MRSPELDVVLVRPRRTDLETTEPILNERVDLGHGVTLGPIDRWLSKEIVTLCEPHKLATLPGSMRGPIRYGFSRKLDVAPGKWNFDEDGRLVAALAMSRLAHPTSVGFEWSARVVTGPGDTVPEAAIGHIKGAAAYAFVVEGSRDWLTRADADLTATLLDAFILQQPHLPPRVQRAIWRHEFAAKLVELDLRWLMIASGLEALLKLSYHGATRGPGSTAQFKRRTVALAVHLGFAWSEEQAERAYELRSEMAHGALVSHADPDLPLYAAMESLLRQALRRSLLDAAFQSLFISDAVINTAFPA
jgi:hypothetical protein